MMARKLSADLKSMGKSTPKVASKPKATKAAVGKNTGRKK
jgi:hypothetical protein